MKTEIYLHTIEYWYEMREDMMLTDSDEEHIENMISQRCHEGELVTFDNESEEEVYGWWKIVK